MEGMTKKQRDALKFLRDNLKVVHKPSTGVVDAVAGYVELPRAAIRWIMSDDTGLSSEFMWSVFAGVPAPYVSRPHDVSDFGRCVRLLKAVPEWAGRVDELARFPWWDAAAPRWASLVDMYERDQLAALYGEIRRISGEAT